MINTWAFLYVKHSQNVFRCPYGHIQGDPVRIFAAFDMRNNTIQVSNILPFRPSNDVSELSQEALEKRQAAKKQTLIITDCPDAFDDYDIAFSPNDHLDIAALAYINYNRQGGCH